MISLRLSTRNELETFDKMDQQGHAKAFINQTGLTTHQKYFDNPNITHLSIENSNGEFSGYFILVVEPATDSVEFRRILIDHDARGVGQMAIAEMEGYCREKIKVKRIWLDVYEDNAIARHIYEKLGYQQFKRKLIGGRKLLFYENNSLTIALTVGGFQSMVKIDYTKELKQFYSPPVNKVVEVNIPEMNFLMVDGSRAPETTEFKQAIEALYAVS